MKAILLIDHGSTRDEANEMLACMAHLVQSMVGSAAIVRFAHMELAAPTIDDGFRQGVEAGATEVVAFPYMLSPGKHSMRDIPRMVGEAAAAFPGVSHGVTPAFGVHEKLAEVILMRAELEPAQVPSVNETCRCWHPTGIEGTCGNACRLRQSASLSTGPR